MRICTCQQFHDLAWFKPMAHLAKEFLLSGFTLDKVCRKQMLAAVPQDCRQNLR
jgi:hypothetical protein